MHLVILALLALALAALMGWAGWRGPAPAPPEEVRPAGLPFDPEVLSEIVEVLLAVMEHRELGGPGFLSVQLPREGETRLTVAAQFPNISEALYRRIAQGRLDSGELIGAGVPRALFSHQPAFETDSGGMVLITARCPLSQWELDFQGRKELLRLLAQALQSRFPGLTVRPLGSELMVLPVLPVLPDGQDRS